QSSQTLRLFPAILTDLSASTSLLHSRHVGMAFSPRLGMIAMLARCRTPAYRFRQSNGRGWSQGGRHARGAIMERRTGSRARVDFFVSALVDGFLHRCRALDLSTSGMLLERTTSLAKRNTPSVAAFRLELPDRRFMFVRGRTVWSRGRYQ